MTAFSRAFTRKNGGNAEVRISAPVRSKIPNGDWECSYQIVGVDGGSQGVAVGGDTIQAIYLALQQVATRLYRSDDFENGEFWWGGWMGASDLGLPIVETALEDIKQIQARVDAIASRKL